MITIATVLFIFGIVTGIIGASKGHSLGGYFVLGVLLGPIGVLIALVTSRTPEAQAQRQLAIDNARRNLES